jgi:repressor LexA
MRALTNRQSEILEYIREFIRAHKYPPTMREIAGRFGISAKGAHDHVKALEKKGKVRFDLGRSRTIEILDEDSCPPDVISVPLIGHVAAGVPLLAEENWNGTVQVPAAALRRGTHFALRVQGDSMEGAGILDGDTAIFEHRRDAENGDIVVAVINDEAITLKRFYREQNRIRLKAENPVYPPIYSQNVRVLGKLECIIRNYE